MASVARKIEVKLVRIHELAKILVTIQAKAKILAMTKIKIVLIVLVIIQAYTKPIIGYRLFLKNTH